MDFFLLRIVLPKQEEIPADKIENSKLLIAAEI